MKSANWYYWTSKKVFCITFTMLLTIGISSPARSEGLQPEHIPADAKWVLHADLERLLDTKLANVVRKKRPEIVQAIREWIKQQYGIEPQSDLMSVTMFSDDYLRYTGTVILKAKYDPEKVKQQINEGNEVKTTEWNGTTLYTITLAKHEQSERQDQAQHDHSGGMEMTVALLDTETVVFGSSVQNTQKVLKVLNGDDRSLDASSELIGDQARDAILYGAAIELKEIAKKQIPMPVLKQHDQIQWVFGEREGELYETATFTASSEDVAKKMHRVLDGIVAYEQLWSADSDSLSKLVENVKLAREGSKVTVRWSGDTETVVAGLNDVMERFGEWRSVMSHSHR